MNQHIFTRILFSLFNYMTYDKSTRFSDLLFSHSGNRKIIPTSLPLLGLSALLLQVIQHSQWNTHPLGYNYISHCLLLFLWPMRYISKGQAQISLIHSANTCYSSNKGINRFGIAYSL